MPNSRTMVLTAISIALFVAAPAAAIDATAKAATSLYADKKSSSPIVGELKAGEAVNATHCGFKWCLIQAQKPRGWVETKYLKFPSRDLFGDSDGDSGGGGGGGGGGAGNAGGIGNAAPGGMIWQFLTGLVAGD